MIEGYFPQVVDHVKWDLAELAMAAASGGKVTKQASHFQVWQRVGYCVICPVTLVSIGKGTGYTWVQGSITSAQQPPMRRFFIAGWPGATSSFMGCYLKIFKYNGVAVHFLQSC